MAINERAERQIHDTILWTPPAGFLLPHVWLNDPTNVRFEGDVTG